MQLCFFDITYRLGFDAPSYVYITMLTLMQVSTLSRNQATDVCHSDATAHLKVLNMFLTSSYGKRGSNNVLADSVVVNYVLSVCWVGCTWVCPTVSPLASKASVHANQTNINNITCMCCEELTPVQLGYETMLLC